jgi:L-aminopeptidase/D-esterase-like protein
MVGKLFGIARAMKGGVGRAALTVNGITVAAIVVVNAVGDVVDPASGLVIAGARSADGLSMMGTTQAFLRGELPTELWGGTATTLGVVMTDAVIDKAAANKLAQMAHDGLARCINPVHTITDGDTVFALGTGASGQSANLTVLGSLAAEVVATAVLRAVRAAVAIGGPGLPSVPAASDFA